MSNDAEATFFTICNEPYFPGTVALLNSLRITGNDGSLVVLDAGLNRVQRARLETHATIVELPGEITRPWLFKAFPGFFDAKGVIVIIDSDMMVTRPLSDVIDKAMRGKICVFPDHFSQTGRWFEEWETMFELNAPLRRQTYVNSGFIALSTTHWPGFLSRFWEASQRVPTETVFSGGNISAPYWAADQDALNALLMSEIPPEAVEVLPAAHEVHPDELANTIVVDPHTLECALNGEWPAILHYSMAPKAWDRRGWLRVRRDAYVRLFSRVVCGGDAPLRMQPEELPLWLRPGASGRMALTALDVTHGVVASIRRRVPPRASTAVLRAKRRLAGPRRS